MSASRGRLWCVGKASAGAGQPSTFLSVQPRRLYFLHRLTLVNSYTVKTLSGEYRVRPFLHLDEGPASPPSGSPAPAPQPRGRPSRGPLGLCSPESLLTGRLLLRIPVGLASLLSFRRPSYPGLPWPSCLLHLFSQGGHSHGVGRRAGVLLSIPQGTERPLTENDLALVQCYIFSQRHPPPGVFSPTDKFSSSPDSSWGSYHSIRF